jgi:hypothetical protein
VRQVIGRRQPSEWRRSDALIRWLVIASRQLPALDDPLPECQKLSPESTSSGGRSWLSVHIGSPFKSSTHNQLINVAIMVSSKADSFKTFS